MAAPAANSGWWQRRRKAAQKRLDFVVEDQSLTVFFGWFVVAVVFFATVYKGLTPYSEGITKTAEPWKAFPLSKRCILAPSSAYARHDNNIYAMGWSKPVVCVEVLFGLTYFGVLIAKITSRRLSYHVQRLYGSQSQKNPLRNTWRTLSATEQIFSN